MSSMSCVVVGDESLLIGCSDVLLERGHRIDAVVSGDDDIIAWAAARGLPHLRRPADLAAAFRPGQFDWLLSIANLSVIPDAVLALPGRGSVNFHDGPLPGYAGLNTPAWALMNGETGHAITWHLIAGGIDEGDIIATAEFDIDPGETAFSLNSKCYAAALDSFGGLLDQLQDGQVRRVAQDLSRRRYFARDDRPAAAGWLDLSLSGTRVARQVRALDFAGYWNPLGLPGIVIAGIRYCVGSAELAGDSGTDAPPGQVLERTADSLSVATGDRPVRLSRVILPDGSRPDLTALVEPGDRLDLPGEDDRDRIGAAMGPAVRHEARLRRAIRAMRPVSVPLARSRGAPSWTAQIIAPPRGLGPEQIVAAILAWGLRGDGAHRADFAVSSADAQARAAMAPGFVTDWIPLRADAGESLERCLERIGTEIGFARKAGGFACDLPARDPAITGFAVPEVGLALDGGGPVAGTVATVTVGPGELTLHTDRGRLDAGAAEILARRLETALHGLRSGNNPETLADVPVLPASERSRMLTDWNRTARPYDRTQTIHQAFEEQVARTPDAEALVFENQCLSYSELNRRANSVAERLRRMGVGPGAHVGLFAARSLELVIAALAILKAGGAYVPLDPAYPGDRIAHYVDDSDASVIVTQTALAGSLPDTDADVLIIDTVADDPDAGDVDGGATADDLAYVIYTSGSTGTPKGVMVEHRNVANFLVGMDDRIDHDGQGVWLALTSLSFDISVLELFWTLTRGFKVVLTGGAHQAAVSDGPVATTARGIEFNLMYWGNDDGPGPKKYELLLKGAQFADANGFNAVWTPERHFHAFGGPYPNPAVTGAAVAAVTSNLSVRAGSCVAPLHHPARIAEDWAVIDNLTGGRAALAIASGWQPDDFVLRPENAPPNNKTAMFESITTLRRLWRGEPVGFARADGTLHEVVTQPRPVSAELPIWVTTAGNPETWKEAGAIGANVLTHLLGQSIDEVGAKIAIYHEALRQAGHDPRDHVVTLMLHTFLAGTRDEARRIAREPMKDYLRAAAGLIKQYAWAFPAFKRPKGVSNPFEMDLGDLSEDELEAILDFAFERYFDESGLFGTVADGAARIEALKRIGVDEVACLIDYGIDPEVVLDGLRPLARLLRQVNQPAQVAEGDFSLAAQILRHRVTHLQCTPSMARIIAMNDEARAALSQVGTVLLGGEALPGDLVGSLRACTDARLVNMYGPTETTIWSTCGAVQGEVGGVVDIGTPIANTSVYVLDGLGQPAPIGVPGELCIGGEGVTRGYWQRQELTGGRFVRDPFAIEAGLTVTAAPQMYRTGDLVRWLVDGRIEFLGRADHQVKIRGQRIELGEIEAVITRFDGVSGAVVVSRDMGGDDLRLIGYVTTSGPVSDVALRRHLETQLPEAMVPAHIVTLDRFPLTPNKKVDRAALPDPAPAAKRADTGPAPQAGGLAARIAEIWSRILGVDGIRADDNFFALGGHSLLAVQAHRELRAELERPDLSITDIFRFPTLAGLAGHIGGDAGASARPAAVDESDRSETMSRRRAMRAERRQRTS